MEQAGQTRAHLERIMLVCGLPNAGKSRLIRRMFADRRLGGHVPVAGPLPTHALSRERCLAGRLTSPHEAGETQAQFHQKIDDACAAVGFNFWRVNYVTAIQPRPRNHMPDIIAVCNGLQREFRPERIRVVQLAPDQWGTDASRLTHTEVDGLRPLDVEVVSVDARRSGVPAEPGNERILADFFDFS